MYKITLEQIQNDCKYVLLIIANLHFAQSTSDFQFQLQSPQKLKLYIQCVNKRSLQNTTKFLRYKQRNLSKLILVQK